MSANTCSVSQQQWDEFKGQFHTVLQLLTCISPNWNLEDPCLISGFDMDRQGTVQVGPPRLLPSCRCSLHAAAVLPAAPAAAGGGDAHL
jgi:hypothetical protein